MLEGMPGLVAICAALPAHEERVSWSWRRSGWIVGEMSCGSFFRMEAETVAGMTLIAEGLPDTKHFSPEDLLLWS